MFLLQYEDLKKTASARGVKLSQKAVCWLEYRLCEHISDNDLPDCDTLCFSNHQIVSDKSLFIQLVADSKRKELSLRCNAAIERIMNVATKYTILTQKNITHKVIKVIIEEVLKATLKDTTVQTEKDESMSEQITNIQSILEQLKSSTQ